eukprot:NODE_972_length_1964_cov_11.380771_g922_i0.p1 GENE.NODE_972_length_1964_cov_11.380771_g922_i0~~NODE_972_length_1964_cov_11.380771_g922_i0.p1  ORF type:complete len:306 (-),score=42.21 NODE_972_length_1964_cov_11.380771_g922_i0:113-1030(-)
MRTARYYGVDPVRQATVPPSCQGVFRGLSSAPPTVVKLDDQLGKRALAWAVAPMTDDRVVLLDRNDQFMIIDTSGKLLHIGGGKGEAPGEFQFAMGPRCAVDGRIFIPDYGKQRVCVFDAACDYLYEFGTRGGGPFKIQMYNDSRVLVHCRPTENEDEDLCEIYSPLGKLLGSMDLPAQLHGVSANDQIYCYSYSSARVELTVWLHPPEEFPDACVRIPGKMATRVASDGEGKLLFVSRKVTGERVLHVFNPNLTPYGEYPLVGLDRYADGSLVVDSLGRVLVFLMSTTNPHTSAFAQMGMFAFE